MIIVGLTGSIASGKSTVAKWMIEQNIAVHDSDATVHLLLAENGDAVEPILAHFGTGMMSTDGGIDRKKLGDDVFLNIKNRKVLEIILHPMVSQYRDQFIDYQRSCGAPLVALDVPLLFETGVDKLCDYTIVVYASEITLKRRALSRNGMTIKKLDGILANQMPTRDKKNRANLSLNTDLDHEVTRQQLFSWLTDLPKSVKL